MRIKHHKMYILFYVKIYVTERRVLMIDNSALFKLPYGLYLLTAHSSKDNACIINTVMQVTAEPIMICVAVNKANLTHDMIIETGIFNVSAITQKAPFQIYSDFGYRSGREVDKFKERSDIARSENGLYYLTKNSSAYLSAKVKQTVGFQTHSVFFAEVTEAVNLSKEETVTYGYYQKNIKPQNPQNSSVPKKGYICQVCGYIYEGDVLPDDYICPVCKHGAEAFRPL